MFTGYSDRTVDFFWGIRFNNSREWFQPRKEEFREVIMTPTKELAGEIYDWVRETAPELNLNLHISRIYRDARRLFGRGPLKDHLWFSLQCAEQNRDEAPCLWFEIGCEGYGFGMGYWMKAGDAQRYRKLIDEDTAAFERLIAPVQAQSTFVLEGEDYAKSRGHAGEAVEAWYNKRWLGLACHRSYDALSYSPALTEELKKGFSFLLPYYRFMDRVYRSAE